MEPCLVHLEGPGHLEDVLCLAPLNEKVVHLNEKVVHLNEEAAPLNEKAAPLNEEAAPLNEKALVLNEEAAAPLWKKIPRYCFTCV